MINAHVSETHTTCHSTAQASHRCCISLTAVVDHLHILLLLEREICVKRFYNIQVMVAGTIEEARAILHDALGAAASAAAASSGAPGQVSAPFVLAVELDTPGVTAERAEAELCPVPTRILYLYSTNQAYEAMNLEDSSRSPVASPNVDLEGMTGVAVAPSPSHAARPPAPDQSIPLSGTAVSPGRPSIVRRVLRKPFKSRSLLQTILTLVQEPLSGEASPNILSPGEEGSTHSPSSTTHSSPTAARARKLSSVANASPPGAAPGLVQPRAAGSRPARIVNIANEHPLRILLAEVRLDGVRMLNLRCVCILLSSLTVVLLRASSYLLPFLVRIMLSIRR